jgi:tRNA (adenine57-N1/adenine58-N1)-methyltransferase
LSKPLTEGEQVLLVDTKQRRYLVTLAATGEFHSHNGVLPHSDLIGQEEGVSVRSSGGSRLLAIRPTLADFVLKMPRGAQVIYPKDLGPILMLADIFPGARVLESGVGSGALSMTLLRAGAVVNGYEMREDFANRAQRNVRTFLGDEASSRYDVEIRDAYEGVDLSDLDRVILDLPEPWQMVPHAAKALHHGGLLVAYTPQITQAAQLRATLGDYGFGLADTIEVLNRGWHIDGLSVRPDHRMVAHTGFLTSARLLS